MARAPHPLAIRRRSGVLLHISSLPRGDLGPDAYRFVDFLVAGGFSIWQLLPICPVDAEGSPYNGNSAFAGNPDFIDRHFLREAPYRDRLELTAAEPQLWQQAFRIFAETDANRSEFQQFLKNSEDWLPDFALYTLLKSQCRGSWVAWPEAYRKHGGPALQSFSEQHRDAIDAICFQQYMFYRQWFALKRYANERGVLIVGDMPIFVAHDSADCWEHQELFLLNDDGSPSVVAGVPPDYFSATGQRWGNPQYNWALMQSRNFQWWIERFQYCFNTFDVIRVDHFRGFQACWYIDAQEEFAINGHWQPVPGAELFKTALAQLGELDIIAEDLGVITPDVEKLRDEFALPGMKILQFAFDGGDDNPYLPANHCVNSVVYTGTHDNNTILGWLAEMPDAEKQHVLAFLGGSEADMPWPMIQLALQSVANTVIVPMQDLLCLGGDSRMNTPGTVDHNWRWRFQWSQVSEAMRRRIASLNQQTSRC